MGIGLRRSSIAVLSCGLFGLLSCLPARAAVDVADYDAFWLWAGVNPQPAVARAHTLYILQGQVAVVRRAPDQGAQLIAQGISVPRLAHGDVWVVYRVSTLHWSEPLYTQLFGQLARWRKAGNPLVGVQIDFDARTRYLNEYVDFLRDFRRRLPADYRLGITGLLDWSSHADPAAIDQLKGVVDEVVVQTYQGRQSIPDYPAYLPRLRRLGLPYRLGLIQGGEWQAPEWLKSDPWFRGYVVFLQNR